MSGILLMKHGGFKTPIIAFSTGEYKVRKPFFFTRETLGIYQQSWARHGRVHQQKMMVLTNRTLDSTINILG